MSTVLYTWLLTFYPEDLRREYGQEMALVFADDLRSRGPLRVWWNAFSEFVRLALPHTLSRPALRVPIIGAAFFLLCVATEVAMDGIFHMPPRFHVFAAIPSFAPVYLAGVVTWVCRGRAIISLRIADR
jgi:hypothetical protein